jgi:hypothetical protein
MRVLIKNPSANSLIDSLKKTVMYSSNNGFFEYNSITDPIIYESPKDVESQLRTFFSSLKTKMCIGNEEEIITFLLTQSKDIDQLIEPFLYINKIVKEKFPDKIKIFIRKYDDPEIKDHYISIDVRKKEYPDDFIDKIWEIRDIFSEKFSENSWLLITTDYKPLLD